MNREQTLRRTLVVGLGSLLGSQLAGACAETDGELLSVPYRTLQPSHDASALNEAEDPSAASDTPLPNQPPPAPTSGDVGSCIVAFCPATFGTPCCTPQAQCGIDLLGICLAAPADAGAGGAPAIQPPTPPTVNCQSDAECTGGEVCCADSALSTFACAASCADTDVPISCRTAADCGEGQVCCGSRSGQTTYTGLACADACDGSLDIVACETNAECGADAGTTCQPSSVLPSGFNVCL